jgi:hypothetical protein
MHRTPERVPLAKGLGFCTSFSLHFYAGWRFLWGGLEQRESVIAHSVARLCLMLHSCPSQHLGFVAATLYGPATAIASAW